MKPTPLSSPARPQRQRALKKFNQEIVASSKELPRPPQLIQTPAPEIALPQPLALPNVLAVRPMPRAVRVFRPPDRPTPKPRLELTLPEAPQMKPATLPKEPALAMRAPRLPALPFTPPELRKKEAILPVLPLAPELAEARGPAEMPRIPKGFTAPASRHPQARPAEPTISTGDATVTVPVGGASLVIVGLNPADAPDIPPPSGSHAAGFSAGPQPHPQGSDSTANDALLVVPNLSVRGGAKEDQPALVAMLAPLTREHMAEAAGPTGAPDPPPHTGATRAATAPDPRLAGRVVYSMAIQMPNITSYSGSWLVWFAEHRPVPGAPPGEMSGPVAQRKVDPKYIPAAVDEKVQGVVRLFAVIRKTGKVDSIEVLRSVDRRLDRSAQEALVKWQFEPARRDGTPVDVDAVFEIPFRLAPRPSK